jgi:hypothetical protein
VRIVTVQPPRPMYECVGPEGERYISDDGIVTAMIGRELDIAEGTVKVHVKHILRKLKLRSRVEAAVWAVEHPRV